LNQVAWAIAGLSGISYIWIDFYSLPITPSARLSDGILFLGASTLPALQDLCTKEKCQSAD
jgi:hypothetical protein